MEELRTVLYTLASFFFHASSICEIFDSHNRRAGQESEQYNGICVWLGWFRAQWGRSDRLARQDRDSTV